MQRSCGRSQTDNLKGTVGLADQGIVCMLIKSPYEMSSKLELDLGANGR